MVRYRDTLWCDGCGVEIRWKPIVKDQRSYCCLKCLNGEVCNCAAILEDYPPTSAKRSGMPAILSIKKLANV
jgi:hypothetical protein